MNRSSETIKDKPGNNLARAVVWDGQIQIAAIISTDMVNECIQRHQMTPVAAAALGRGMMAAVFLGLNLKSNDTITLRILGNGPLGGMITQAGADHKVKGYVGNSALDLPLSAQGKLDVGAAVGNEGDLYVTKDMGLKEPYTGSCHLISGEIAEDLAYYFHQSEQCPVVVSLGVLIDVDGSCHTAAGYMIKALPGIDDTKLQALEEWLNILPPVSALADQLGNPTEMLQALFPKETLSGLTEETWSFGCDCNRQRLERLLISMGPKELNEIIEQDGKASMRCHFCGNTYDFSQEDLEALVKEIEIQKLEAASVTDVKPEA